MTSEQALGSGGRPGGCGRHVGDPPASRKLSYDGLIVHLGVGPCNLCERNLSVFQRTNFAEFLTYEVRRIPLLGTSVNRRRGAPRSVSSRSFPLLLGCLIRGYHAVVVGLMFWLRRKRLSGS